MSSRRDRSEYVSFTCAPSPRVVSPARAPATSSLVIAIARFAALSALVLLAVNYV